MYDDGIDLSLQNLNYKTIYLYLTIKISYTTDLADKKSLVINGKII